MSLLKFSVLGLCIVFAGISIVLSHRSEGTRISPPKIYEQAEKVIYFKDRDTVRLNCVASGSPQPEYRWERNGLPFYADNLRIHRYGSRTGSLIFNPATSLDAGFYQCFADNGHGVSMSQKMHLRTAVLDIFPDQPSRTVRVDPGDPLLLQCISPRSIPRPDIYWVTIREGSSQLQVVETDDRITIDEFDNLLFANVMKADEREGRGYSCVVVNNIKRDMVIGPITYIELANEGPQKAAPAVHFMSSPSDSWALVGQALKLQCIFAGNPTPNVTWEYDTTNPASSIKYTEDFGKTLKFENVTQADEGVYTCHGFNSQSRVVAARRITVRVQALPYWTTRPRGQEARVGESVTFTCEASGRPVPTYQWFIDAVPYHESSRAQRVTKVSDYSLRIDDVRSDDNLNVQCNMTNKHGYLFGEASLKVVP